MTTEASRRLHLYETARQGWGPEAADTLMELLPPEPDSLATKADVAMVKADLRTEIAELRAEVHQMFAEQTRTLLLANVGMWITTVSLSFAVAKLA
jgi:hypothetical protein